MPIPFNRPFVTSMQSTCLQEALASSHHSGDGPFTRRCHERLEAVLNAKKVLLTTSCTHALELCALLLDFRPGDEVIVPSFTFVSTANAFALRGARIVFADVREDTLNLDETQLERLITPHTRAIVPVHYGGIGCEMDRILQLAKGCGVAVIEDNAHGLFGRYRGRPLGSFGALATQSFHETKNLSCGEGGALVINDERYMERAEILREKGTDRARFFRGQIDKYTWVDLGSSYLPSDLLAAVLWAQLEAAEQIQERRQRIWLQYASALQTWAAERDYRLPIVPTHCDAAWHLFYIVFPSLAVRQSFLEYLKRHDIHAVFHYQPLHLSEMGRRWGGRPGDCPVTERLGDCLVRLPFHTGLTETDQDRVIETVRQFPGTK